MYAIYFSKLLKQNDRILQKTNPQSCMKVWNTFFWKMRAQAKKKKIERERFEQFISLM